MEDRIKKFMEYKGISPSELADSIGVQRSNVTHVLKARNKPSFQFIEKMLQVYPDLNAKWLVMGTGSMVDAPAKSKTLFDELTESSNLPLSSAENRVENRINEEKSEKPEIIESATEQSKENIIPPFVEKKAIQNELQDQFFSSEKPIERLIVFFKDQTFKVYNPSK
jgi:transcriptional regulator with XRE-family HTH domain